MSPLLNYGAIVTGIRGVAEIKEALNYPNLPHARTNDAPVASTARGALLVFGAVDLYQSYKCFRGGSLHPIVQVIVTLFRLALFIKCSEDEKKLTRLDKSCIKQIRQSMGTQLFLSIGIVATGIFKAFNLPRTSLYTSNAFSTLDLIFRMA